MPLLTENRNFIYVPSQNKKDIYYWSHYLNSNLFTTNDKEQELWKLHRITWKWRHEEVAYTIENEIDWFINKYIINKYEVFNDENQGSATNINY